MLNKQKIKKMKTKQFAIVAFIATLSFSVCSQNESVNNELEIVRINGTISNTDTS